MEDELQGLILKGIGGFYYVKVGNSVIECKARGKFRHDGLTPMVGDHVQITENKGKGTIDKILTRSSKLKRPPVANVNQVFIVFAADNPPLNEELLNKFLVMSEYNNFKTYVCINKTDLATEDKIKNIEEMMLNTGYELLYLQAKTGFGMDIITEKVKGNISVFCGPSGVGKSTIVNKITGKKSMEVGEISERIHRGKNTTRHSELLYVEGGYIVDTPGFSSMEIDEISDEKLQFCFPEFRDYIGSCKFVGCKHNKEIGCSVKEAVSNSEINIKRYNYYIKILTEDKKNRR